MEESFFSLENNVQRRCGILLIAEFIICSAIIFFAGSRLAIYGDQIGERTGLGQIWIGVFILALLTSLPELVTNIGAVTIARQPNLAMGNVLGSNMCNLAIIAILDILQKREPILTHVRQEHILSAGFGILLMAVVVLAIILTRVSGLGNGFGYFCSLLIVGIYIIAMILINRMERKSPNINEIEFVNRQTAKRTENGKDIAEMPIIKVVSLFVGAAIIVVLAGLWLVKIGASLSHPFYVLDVRIDLGATFVGTLFLAFATSLPEVAVSSAAVRIGAFDMAVGNILGSNIFNMFIIPISDIFYKGNNIFSSVSDIQILTAILGIILTSLAIIALIYRSKKDLFYMGWDTISMIIVYILGLFVLFQVRNINLFS